MLIRVGINGFGRMGRLALRAALDLGRFDIVHINEIAGGVSTAAHLLEFDSVHGRWRAPIGVDGDSLTVYGRKIGFSNFAAPLQAPWKKARVDIVLECSGKFRTVETLQPYLDLGVRKVIVAAPVKSGVLNLVSGVNDHLYKSRRHLLITTSSSTTNCLAPVVKVIHEKLAILHGAITTVHDATNTQT